MHQLQGIDLTTSPNIPHKVWSIYLQFASATHLPYLVQRKLIIGGSARKRAV